MQKQRNTPEENPAPPEEIPAPPEEIQVPPAEIPEPPEEIQVPPEESPRISIMKLDASQNNEIITLHTPMASGTITASLVT